MIDKEKILEKVLQSSEFKESKRYQELLKYLVKASENEENVKETTIAAELFGRDSSFNPHEDPTIRVYISNLRKKLEHYYFTEGKEDKIKIHIPKGHYYLKFVPIEKDKNKLAANYKYLTYFFLTPLIILLIAIIIFLKYKINLNDRQNIFSEKHPFWGEFLQKNDDPTLLVFGDYFFLYENKKGTEGGYFVRDPRINSPDEFKQLLKKNPSLIERFVACNFTYLGPSSAESMTYILPILLKSPNKIFVKLSSQLKGSDLNKYNIIFVGSFKTLFDLNKLFSKIPFQYQIYPPKLILFSENSDTVETYCAMSDERLSYKKDYGVIIKHLAPENHSIMLLTGFDELGVIEAVKRITDVSFITQLSNSFHIQNFEKPFLFTSFIEVEGIDRLTFNSKIEYFKRLE